ncbi:hypothetical protein Moror_5867 [Moniliophthora roreri MCA 2997]|uniref:DUF6534 domain-containing protein n=1 Tax=Moniliophthora roreri (strain MCA 2997) TaxID=1381753 RepID=V2X360_MONRO|nr:hypothetical protein Moror_5867 [Moniliophthora roreri MCA 2997]
MLNIFLKALFQPVGLPTIYTSWSMDNSESTHLAAPLLLGYLLNWGLYGVLTVQVCLYWAAFPNDSLYAQTLVYGVYLLETAQTISVTRNAFQSLVFGFEDFVSLTKLYNLWLDTYAFDGLVALIFQVYFANRLHVLLSGARILPGIIVLLALTQFAGGIGSAITIGSDGVFPAYTGRVSSTAAETIPGYLWTGCGMLADVLIAVTMVYALSRYDTTFRKAQGLVKRLSQLMIEIGGLTAAMSLVQPLLFLIYPDKTYHITPALVIAKLYSNSLLATFNSRIHILGARGTAKKGYPAPNPDQNPIQSIQLTGSQGNSTWVPTTFLSRLDFDMDSVVLMNTTDSKADTVRA